MRIAFCVTPLSKDIPVREDVDYIGVDDGSYRIVEAGLRLSYALGDFDSMSQEKYEELCALCPVEKHPIMKNETDSELAIMRCKEMGYDQIILYGAITGRLDHTLLNIRLLTSKHPDVILMDHTQKVTLLKKGTHTIDSSYKNISFLPMEETILTLKGFLYVVEHTTIHLTDTYTTSNSLIDDLGIVEIKKGCMLCIQTNER